MANEVDLRCISNPKQLLGKLRLSGEKPEYLLPDNLISLFCRDCSRELTLSEERERGEKLLVTHLFDFAGEFVRTEERVVRAGERRADTQGDQR